MRPEGALSGGNQNNYFGLDVYGTSNELFIGKPGAGAMTNYVLEDRGGSNQVASGASVVLDQTALLVVKAEFNAYPTPDVFTLYANPSTLGVEPASGVVKTMSDIGAVNQLVIYSTGAFGIDEIREGMTYADVTPVPEPSVLTLFCIAAISWLGFAWRWRTKAS